MVDSSGFVRQSNGRWKWDRHTETPWLETRVYVNESSDRFGGYDWVDTGRWTLVEPPRGFAYYSATESQWIYPTSESSLVAQKLRVAGQGFAGRSMAYLGATETYVRNTQRERFTLVVPAASTVGTEPERLLDMFETASRHLAVGDHHRSVNVFVAPDPIRDGGLVGGVDGETVDFWVAENESADGPANIWLHEYVHARQQFTLGPRMEWFEEASASYYAGLLAVRQGLGGRAGFDRFQNRLHRDRHADAVLSDRSTWRGPMVPYSRGQRVLASLDARIRNASDGNRSLLTVFRRVNGHDGPLEYDDFRQVVSNVTSDPQRAWLDARIAGRDPVTPPESPFAYVKLSGTGDADGDGLVANRERALGTHPFESDSDDDGVADGVEIAIGTDPTQKDTDGDGYIDGVEAATFADPTNAFSTPAAPVGTLRFRNTTGHLSSAGRIPTSPSYLR
jgi:hypothetical protein